MRLPRFRLRTLMITVAIAGVVSGVGLRHPNLLRLAFETLVMGFCVYLSSKQTALPVAIKICLILGMILSIIGWLCGSLSRGFW